MSTDLTIGADGDMPCKADMLISEILDSALLGEGVLPFLRHALSDLVAPNAIVVPAGAAVFGQVVSCSCLADYHTIPSPLHNATLWRDARSAGCNGGRVLIPVHQRELRAPPTPLSEAINIFNFDLTSPSQRQVVSISQQFDRCSTKLHTPCSAPNGFCSSPVLCVTFFLLGVFLYVQQ